MAITAMSVLGLGLGVLVVQAVVHFLYGYTGEESTLHAFGLDDAFISYRYAENLVLGHGLVYNPGEYVQGYTNPLFVLICAGFFGVVGSGVYPVVFVFNVLCLCATAWVFFAHLGERFEPRLRALGFLLFCCCPLLWLWPASGMETSLVLLVQMVLWRLTAQLCEEPSRRLACWFAAVALVAVWLRSDGVVFPFFCVLALAVKGHVRWAAGLLAALGVSVATSMGWSQLYYGDFLPNTYYAKVTGSLGQRYSAAIRSFFRISWRQALLAWWLPILVHLGIARRISLGAMLGLPLIAYWIHVGGDFFLERFLLILVPLGIVALLELLRHVTGPRLLLVGAAWLALALTPLTHDVRFGYTADKTDMLAELGTFLGDRHPGATLAIDGAGKVPFFSKMPTIDMLGLNDAHIAHLTSGFSMVAHSKYDADYVLGRRPALISAWASGPDHLKFGLARPKYRAAGYRLAYATGLSADIVEVEDRSDRARKALWDAGLRYWVLERDDP